MNFLELILTIIKLICSSIQISIPNYLIYIFLFALASILVEFIFLKTQDYKWNKSLRNIDTELADKKLFNATVRNICFEKSESKYFERHNNFFIEAFYFLATTLIFVAGVILENYFLILLFFAIKTIRKIIIAYNINLEGINLLISNNFNEDEVYYNLCLLDEKEFFKLFETNEPSLIEEFSVLELKFKELIRCNKINKDIIVNLINSKEITTNIINMINSEYSKLVSQK